MSIMRIYTSVLCPFGAGKALWMRCLVWLCSTGITWVPCTDTPVAVNVRVGRSQLRRHYHLKQYYIEVDLDDLTAFDDDLANKLQTRPTVLSTDLSLSLSLSVFIRLFTRYILNSWR